MSIEQRLAHLRNVRRVVVKIGSGVLKSAGEEELDSVTLDRLVDDLCALEADGRFEVVLVSSGAVMAGRKYLALPGGKLTIPQRQAAAAAGQMKLMNLYERSFARHGRKVAQILLTHGDIEERGEGEEGRYFNVRNTINTLLGLQAVPVINENDSTAVDELKFGDNDTLAAKITSVVGADLLLILSDVEGLYTADPRKDPSAVLVDEVRDIAAALRQAGESGTRHGTGGMKAKVMAAKIACDYGPAWIISGKQPAAITAALRSGKGGTYFHAVAQTISAHQHWIMHISKPKGRIVVDDGARRALVDQGRSLLPSGIVAVEGDFKIGAPVDIVDAAGREIARGLANYGSDELQGIKGKKTAEVEAILGEKEADEAVHRDNMVIWTGHEQPVMMHGKG